MGGGGGGRVLINSTETLVSSSVAFAAGCFPTIAPVAAASETTTTTATTMPKFPYRGLMLDTARHFLPLDEVLQALDGMAGSSLNVLHWHLTDAQAFPWNATAGNGRLVEGAYRGDLTYVNRSCCFFVTACPV